MRFYNFSVAELASFIQSGWEGGFVLTLINTWGISAILAVNTRARSVDVGSMFQSQLHGFGIITSYCCDQIVLVGRHRRAATLDLQMGAIVGIKSVT